MLCDIIITAKAKEKKYNRYFSAAKEKAVSAVLSIVGIVAVFGGIILPVLLH